MKLLIKALMLSVLTSFAASGQQTSLSDYERFVSYPYIEKAYRLQEQKAFSAAIDEIEEAIRLVPDYVQFHELRLELAVQAGRDDYALALYRALPASWFAGTRFDEILLNADIPLDEEIFDGLMARVLAQPGLLNVLLERLIGGGKNTQALEILESMPDLTPEALKQKLRIAASLQEQQQVIDTFESLSEDQRDTELVRIYVFAQFDRGNFSAALEAIKALEAPQDKSELMSEYVQRTISAELLQEAYEGLLWLSDHGTLSQTERTQILELALRLDHRKDILALLASGQWSCSKAIDAYLSAGERPLAQRRFEQCHEQLDDTQWLSYADTFATSGMLNQALETRPDIAPDTLALLLNRLVAQESYEEIAGLIPLTSSDPDKLQMRAISLEKTGNTLDAARAWQARYALTGYDSDLEQASFLFVEGNRPDAAYALLTDTLERDKTLSSSLSARLLSLLDVSSDATEADIVAIVRKLTGQLPQRAEVLRVAGHCEEALALLEQQDIFTAQAFRTRALCYQELNPDNAVVAWKAAYHLSSDPSDVLNAAQLQVNQVQPSAALESLESVPEQQRDQRWHILRTRIAFQLGETALAWQLWQSINEQPQDWQALGLDIALSREDWPRVEAMLRETLSDSGALTSEQWAVMANVYDLQGDPEKSLRAREMATSLAPDDADLKVAYGFSLISSDPQAALAQFEAAAAITPDLPLAVWEQMAYLSEQLGEAEKAKSYIARVVHTSNLDSGERYTDKSWRLKRLYRTLEEHWKFTATATHGTGAVLGDVFFLDNQGVVSDDLPTNSLIGRAEYFFNNVNEGASVYAQLAANGSDNGWAEQVSQELGLTYKVFTDYNTRISTGILRFLEGDNDWQGFVRVNGDAFNKDAYRIDWRQADSWVERQLYYDLIYYYETDQVVGQAIFDMGIAHSLTSDRYQTLKYYGLARYDYVKTATDVNGDTGLYEAAIGLGLVWRLYLSGNTVEDRIDRLSLGVEWRQNISGELSQDNNGLFFLINYEY